LPEPLPRLLEGGADRGASVVLAPAAHQELLLRRLDIQRDAVPHGAFLVQGFRTRAAAGNARKRRAQLGDVVLNQAFERIVVHRVTAHWRGMPWHHLTRAAIGQFDPGQTDLRCAEAARFDPGTRGVFMGYDFHLDAAGPRLIEINANGAGAMLNAVL
jgi:hypothetical protein